MNDSSDNTEDPKDQDEIKELVVVLENRLDQLVKIFIQSGNFPVLHPFVALSAVSSVQFSLFVWITLNQSTQGGWLKLKVSWFQQFVLNYNICILTGRKLAVKKKVSPYNYPSWKEDLRKSYKEIIIDTCTKLTRDAVDGNEIIKVYFEKKLKK